MLCPTPRPEIQLTAAEMALAENQHRLDPVPNEVLLAMARIKKCWQQSIDPAIVINISPKHVRMLSIGDLKLVTDYIESQENA